MQTNINSTHNELWSKLTLPKSTHDPSFSFKYNLEYKMRQQKSKTADKALPLLTAKFVPNRKQ
jgi:hypothetical protein